MRRSFGSLALFAGLLSAAAAAEDASVKHVEAAGAQFPYVEAGEGEPVLFVHGAFADHRAWEPMREQVADSHRFIAYTQRGFGTGEWPEEPAFARDVHDADLAALLDAWGEPMHLVGWSYSGPIVLRAALERPDLVRSVVIFEPGLDDVLSGKPEHEEALAAWGEGWGPADQALQRGAVDEAVQRSIEYVFGLPQGDIETLPEEARTMFLENAHTVPKLFGSPPPSPLTCEDLGGIEAPVLILWGTETLPYFEAVAKELVNCVPAATLEEIPNTGHGGPMEARDAFLEKTLSFIREAGDS